MADPAAQAAYGYQPLEHLSDEELDYLLGHQQETQAATQKLSDEELNSLLQNFEAPGGNMADEPPVVNPPPPSLTAGEEIGGAARELAGGALFELSDEAEAAARAPFSSKTYDELVNEIRLERAKYGQARPYLAPALNLAGGIGSMFVPGAGAVGRGVQAATRIDRLASPVARTVASTSLAGSAAGFGSGEGLTDSLGNAVIGGTLGAPLGLAGYGAGKAARWGKDVFTARGAEMTEEEAARHAAEIISRRISEGGLTPEQAAKMLELEQTYGIPSVFGTVSPELSRLTENVMQTPSGERAALAERLFTQQGAAPSRVRELAKNAVPTPDYFASEERIINTLRSNAERNYGSGWKDVEVTDPRIIKILSDPDIRSAYMDALSNVRRRQTEAVLAGEDPSQFKLREIFEPVLNEEGALIGLSSTGKEAPNMGTLNEVKIALDRKISSLYQSGQGGQATALRGIRDAFVKRLDDIGPDEYKAARQQYKGDIEIKEALEQGRNSAGPGMRWQEFSKLAREYSPGEQQALKTGFMQGIMKRFEDTGNSRNFAKDLLKGNDLRKFQAVMDPGEFQVFEAALRRESELFGEISRITQGSATFGRAAEKADIENQLAGGNVAGAMDLFLNPSPGNLLRKTAQILTKMRDANVSRATYTQLARMLKAGTPDEVNAVLRQLEEAAPVQQAADRALERRATKTSAGLATSVAPPPEDKRGQTPETTEVVIPSLDQGVVPAVPIGAPEAAAAPQGPGGGTLDIQSALLKIMPDWQMSLGGDIIGASGAVMEAPEVAKALGIPLEAWLAYVGGAY